MEHVFPPSHIDDIKKFFDINGYVLVSVLSPEQCVQAVKDQVSHILLKQPWATEYQLKVHDRGGKEISFQRDPDEYVKALMSETIPPNELKGYLKAWPLHKSFGACCDNSCFHMPTVWNIRQDPRLYNIARALLGREDLWVDINRSIQKLPGCGEEEFLHWDKNVFFKEYSEDKSVQGKVMFTNAKFVMVRKTHTVEFHSNFKRRYKSSYLNILEKHTKVGLDRSKSDPWEICTHKETIFVPAGCAIFWSTNLLHGTEKSGMRDNIEFGTYLGYMEPKSRKEYQVKAHKRIENVNKDFEGNGYLNGRSPDELQDRIYSYRHGVAPILWPSLDEIHFFPKAHVYLPQNMDKTILKMTEDARADYSFSRMKQNGEGRRDVLKPWPNDGYVPPPLTELGQKLLGLKEWDP
jgi:hypothetical protein